MARRILNLLEGLLNLVTMLIIVVVGAYAGYALWDNQQIYASAGNVQAELLAFKKSAEEDEANIKSMFAELKAINPDVLAWLTLDNTNIDYPVVQGKTNYDYLNTDVYGKFSLAGSIFFDFRLQPDISEPYILVHGHHMADHLMFGDLDYYKDQAFFEENRTGTLILEDRSYELKTIACLAVSATDINIFLPERWKYDIEGLLEYARSDVALHYNNDMIERLLKENELARQGEKMPQIISFATCSSEHEYARTILLAEMIPIETVEGEDEP